MFTVPLALLVLVPIPDGQPASSSPTTQQVRQAIARSVPFLLKGGLDWRDNRKCVTCHQIPMTIWSCNEARSRGIAVDQQKLDDLTAWALNFCATNKNKGELTGGFLLTMDQMILAHQTVPKAPVEIFARFEPIIARYQRPDGSWKEGNQVSVKGAQREADEVDTMWTVLALASLEKVGEALPSDGRAKVVQHRTRALAWLKEGKPATRTDWLALRMLVEREFGQQDRALGMQKELLARQNQDGGWGFVQGDASHPHASGESLYALSVMGVSSSEPAIGRAWGYLLKTQQADGSWKALSRQALGAGKPVHVTPISIHWGTAWATIGLLRTLPE